MEDHAARNRAFWDARSAEWVEPGRKAWARDAIVSEAQKRGMTPFLPPLVPFGSRAWPWKITPGPGPATIGQSVGGGS